MKHGKNNSLKQTKHKRQLKYNRSRSSKTTHKRQKGQIQYGGKEYTPGTLPGYSEISEVMKHNYDPPLPPIELQKLHNYRARIIIYKYKKGDVIPDKLPRNTLIQLKNSLIDFGGIEYDDKTYLKLASLNLERIILGVLRWNPFLNFPHNYEEYTPVEIYGQHTKPRVEERLGVDEKPIFLNEFFDNEWWNLQPWWNKNKTDETKFPLDTSRRLESAKREVEREVELRKAAQRAQRAQLAEATPAAPANPATPAAPAAPAAEQNKHESILELQQEVERLQQEVESLKQEVIRLTAENDELQANKMKSLKE